MMIAMTHAKMGLSMKKRAIGDYFACAGAAAGLPADAALGE